MTCSLEIELDGLRQENQRLREMNEALLRGQFPERDEEKTLRDEMAMATLPAIFTLCNESHFAEEMSEWAYAIADAMLEMRKK